MDPPKDSPPLKPSFFDTDETISSLWKTRDLSDFATYPILSEHEFFTYHKRTFSEWESCYLSVRANFLIFAKNKKPNQAVKYIDLNAYMHKVKQLHTGGKKPKKYRFSFSISTHGKSAEFYCKDEAPFAHFYNLLRDFCILSNYKEHYNTLEVLGSGGYGQVYLVEDKITKMRFAAKVIQISPSMNLEKQKVMIKNEVKILKKLDHPNITKLHEVYENDDEVCLIIDYVNGKRLFDQVVRRGKLSERETAIIMKQLFLTLSHLEANTIIHRDIKPENMLLSFDAEGQVMLKLIDFGLSTDHLKRDIIKKCGTAGYTAPEILCGEPYDFKADLYSAGIVMYICLIGRPTFAGSEYRELLEENRRGVIQFKEKYWANISPEALDLVQRILVANPQQRISLDTVLAHKWFEKVLLPEEMKEIHDFNIKTGNILFGEEDQISSIPVTTLHASRLTMGSRSCSIASISPRFVTSKTAFGASSRHSPMLHSFYKYKTRDELEAETDYTFTSPTLKNGYLSRGLSLSSPKRKPTIKKGTLDIFDLKQFSPKTAGLNLSPSIELKNVSGARLKLQRIAKGIGAAEIDSSIVTGADEEGSPVGDKYENLQENTLCFDQLYRSSHYKKQSPKSTRKNINFMSTTYSMLLRENH